MDSTENPAVARRWNMECRNVRWTDVLQFIFFNYILHAATIISSPGDGIISATYSRLIVLFLPPVGTIRAVRVIYRFARGEGKPLDIALGAQALCMIGPAEPEPTEEAFVQSLRHGWVHNTVSLRRTTVQGQHPITYSHRQTNSPRLVIVPANYTVQPPLTEGPQMVHLAYNYSVAKILAAIAQILYASFQHVRNIETFRISMYSLTTIPYIAMSVFNLLAVLCEPEFPAMFLVRTDEQGGPEEISGEVGRVAAPAEDENVFKIRMRTNPFLGWMLAILRTTILIVAILGSCIIIYFLGLGDDTGLFLIWEMWAVLWFAYGLVLTVVGVYYSKDFTRIPDSAWGFTQVITFFGVLIGMYGFSCVVRSIMNDEICMMF